MKMVAEAHTKLKSELTGISNCITFYEAKKFSNTLQEISDNWAKFSRNIAKNY